MSRKVTELVAGEKVELPTVNITDGEFASYTRHQIGVVLTIIEASIPEGKQLEATKSLVKSSLHKVAEELMNYSDGQESGNGGTFPFKTDF